MKILFVSQGYPNANGRGYERRAAQHLAALKTLGEVTLVLPGQAVDSATVAGLVPSELGVARLIVRREATKAEVSQRAYDEAKTRLGRLFHGLRRRYDTDQFALKVDQRRYRELLGCDFDLIFAFRIGSAIWVDSVFGDTRSPRSIVDFDDIESLAMVRNSAGKKVPPLWRFIISRYVARLARMEELLAKSWALALVCSDHDVAKLQDRGLRALPIPNAVPFPAYHPESESGPAEVLFVGTLSYRPNVEGISWFVREVWPRIRAELGNRISLSIAGYDPPPDVLALASNEGITVLGPVDNLAPVYARTNLIVAPIFSGSGTRIKILEAFAFQRAVVTTAIGCEGLSLESDRHAMIADDAEAFGTAVLTLARDPTRRRMMAKEGHDFGWRLYSHDVVARRFVTVVQDIAEGRIS